MKHDKWKVFVPAVFTMMGLHLMSVGLGQIFPLLFSRNAIVYFSVLLFLFFGILMLWEAYHLKEKTSEEKLAEMSQTLVTHNEAEASENMDKTPTTTASLQVVLANNPQLKDKLPEEEKKSEEKKMFCSNPYLQLVLLLFLGDWGDRCQISAIVLTATYNVWGVAAGGALVFIH
jgi:putative Ca2+/H+ antiporter (TMEM165/GDT1 family)